MVSKAKTLYWSDEDEALLRDVKSRLGLRGDSETVRAALWAHHLNLLPPGEITPAQRIERIKHDIAELEKVLK